MDVWVLIGDRFEAAGKPQRAQVWFSRVLDKDANNPTAADKLETLGLQRVTPVSETGCTGA